MRNAFCAAMVALAQRERYAFLTGDLGFMALEPLQQALGRHFINAGVSEQNMVSMAAGMASVGLKSWAYSIAPFCYARPFEQIRNDVCLNQLPVRLVANGGGYAYGPMGATHHALEDYGILLTLPGMRVYLPAFDSDIDPMVRRMSGRCEPCYLRLGRSELGDEGELPDYAAWRCLQQGAGGLIIAAGPLAGALLTATRELPDAERPTLWVLSELLAGADPALPPALLAQLELAPVLAVVEEHVAQGGVGQVLLHALALQGRQLPPVVHAHALGYVSGRYGSQGFHRLECGLDAATVLARMRAAAERTAA
jgi:transketolase